MEATGVIYTDELNRAYAEYGVSPALLRALLDFLNVDLFPLPELAERYAQQLAVAEGISTPQNLNGAQNPSANYRAMAWYLTRLREVYTGDWTPVAIYLGGGPVAERQAETVARKYFPEYDRSWR